MKNDIDQMEAMAAFASLMKIIRQEFPEHSLEIDRCIFDVGQKLSRCNKPGCNCQITFEEFHEGMNQKHSVNCLIH